MRLICNHKVKEIEFKVNRSTVSKLIEVDLWLVFAVLLLLDRYPTIIESLLMILFTQTAA